MYFVCPSAELCDQVNAQMLALYRAVVVRKLISRSEERRNSHRPPGVASYLLSPPHPLHTYQTSISLKTKLSQLEPHVTFRLRLNVPSCRREVSRNSFNIPLTYIRTNEVSFKPPTVFDHLSVCTCFLHHFVALCSNMLLLARIDT